MRGKPKILIIASLPPPYHGCTLAAQSLLDSKIQDIFDVSHLDTSDHRGFKNLGRFDLINIFLGLKNVLQLGYHCVRRRPDLAYILPGTNIGSCLREGLFVLLATSLGRTRMIAHFHTSSFEEFYLGCGFLFRRFIDLFLKRTDCAIVLGDRLRPMVARWFSADRIEVVTNGTEFDPYQGRAVDKSFQHAPPVRITYMSNIDAAKGILILLEALQSLMGDTAPFRLTVAGAWTAGGLTVKDTLDDLIQRGSLRDVVHLSGIVRGADKEALLQETDIFVLPSLAEAQPKSILEAMSAACPVVSTRVGAIPETVVDGETGLLVEKEDVPQLAAALRKLIEDPKLREKMGRAGRNMYERYYTKEKHIDNIIRVFKKITAADIESSEKSV